MRNKAVLVLMEQLVMLLVFALAAALCLGCFASAASLSGETAVQDEAVWLARNTAERLKAGLQPTVFPGESGLVLEIRELPEEIPGLRQARIQVIHGQEVVFTLCTGWQEVE